MIFRKPGTAKSGPQNKQDMEAPKYVIDEFKRNPDVKAIHTVLTQMFTELKRAENYRRSINAVKVNTILRSECAAQLGETAATENE